MSNLQLGGVYQTQFDQRPFRIIGLDDHEVFYDCLWSDGKWTFSGSFKAKTIFYRMPTKLFKEKSEFVESNPLSELEFKYFRPDLPMRFGRTKGVSWANRKSVSKHLVEGMQLSTDKIVLVPYGPKGGYQKGVLVEGSTSLAVAEIIEKAFGIQQAVNGEESSGIGFYRLGFERGLPRYAIGEYLDRAGVFAD